jgi:hypothetical protein
MAGKISKTRLNYAAKYLEYKNDPIKFIEECIYIPTTGGSTLIKLHKPQKKILQSFFNDHHLILLKSRQLGFSTLCQVIIVYITTFYDNCVCGIVSRSGEEATDFCRKTENMIDQLPLWIRPKYKKCNEQSYILTNGSALFSSAISPQNPGAVFRGKSLSLLIFDELAHVKNADQAWTGVSPALSKSQNTAKLNNIPFGTIFLSTPNGTAGIGKFFFTYWKESENKMSIFQPHQIHWSEIPEYANDPQWYKNQCALLNHDRRKIAQELELKFITSDGALFDEDIQETLQEQALLENTVKEEISIPSTYTTEKIWKFKNININKFHIISVDTASQSGTDFSTVESIEYETMDQVLEFKGKLPVKEFANKVVKLCAKLCPHNIILIENNSYGTQVIEELMFDEEYQYNLFGEIKNKIFVPGLNTNLKTRPLIIDSLFTYIKEDPSIIKSKRLVFELLSLTNKNNRVEADSGCNDDLVLAYAFVCYAKLYAKERLGDVSDLNLHFNEEIDKSEKDMTSLLFSLNQEAPLYGNFLHADGMKKFQHDVSDYVNDRVGYDETSGFINTFDLFRK